MSRRTRAGGKQPLLYDEDDDDEEVNESAENFDDGYDSNEDYDDQENYYQPPPPDHADPLLTLPIRSAPPAAGAAPITGVGASQVPQAYADYAPAIVKGPLPTEITSGTDNYPYYDDGPRRANEDEKAAERRIDRASLAMGLKRKGVFSIMYRQKGQSEAEWQYKWNMKEQQRKKQEALHKSRMDPTDALYDATYQQYWAADKASRRAFNVQRRANALAHRRAYDVAQGRPQAADPDPAEGSGDERYAPRQWNDSPSATKGPFRQDPPPGFPLLGYMPAKGNFPVGIRTNPPSDRCEPCHVGKKGVCDLGRRGWYPCTKCVEADIVAQCVNGKGHVFNAERYPGWKPPVGTGIPSNAGPPPSRRSPTTAGPSGPSAPRNSDDDEDDGGDYGAGGRPKNKRKKAKARASRADRTKGTKQPITTLTLRGRRRERSASADRDRSASPVAAAPDIPTIYLTKPLVVRDFIIPRPSDRVVRVLGHTPLPGTFPMGIRTNPHSNKCMRCHLYKKGTCDLQVKGYPCSDCVKAEVPHYCVNAAGYKAHRDGSLRDKIAREEALRNKNNATDRFNAVSEEIPQPRPGGKTKPKLTPTRKPNPNTKPGTRRRSRSPAKEKRQACDECRNVKRKCEGPLGNCNRCRKRGIQCVSNGNPYRDNRYIVEDEEMQEDEPYTTTTDPVTGAPANALRLPRAAPPPPNGFSNSFDSPSQAREPFNRRQPLSFSGSFGGGPLMESYGASNPFDNSVPGYLPTTSSTNAGNQNMGSYMNQGPLINPPPGTVNPRQVVRNSIHNNPPDYVPFANAAREAEITENVSSLTSRREEENAITQNPPLNSFWGMPEETPQMYHPADYEMGQLMQQFNNLSPRMTRRSPRFTPSGPSDFLSDPFGYGHDAEQGSFRSHAIQEPVMTANSGLAPLPDTALFSYNGSGNREGPNLDPFQYKAPINRIAPSMDGWHMNNCDENLDFFPEGFTDGPICGNPQAGPCHIQAEHGTFYSCHGCQENARAFMRDQIDEVSTRVKAFVCTTCAPQIRAKSTTKRFLCDCLQTWKVQPICNRHMSIIYQNYDNQIPLVNEFLAETFPHFAVAGADPCVACGNLAADRNTNVWACKLCRCWVRGG